MDRVELKTAAKNQIKGNIGAYFVCMLVTAVICGALECIPKVGPIIAFIFVSPISLGFTHLALGMTRGEKVHVKKLFESFNDFERSLLVNLLVAIFTFLWSLLLVVPGIIKGLSYSMSLYILADNPDMTAKEAFEESKTMMEGHKLELFVLILSFILWDILTVVTCGIASIYVAPYKVATFANYYNKLKNEEVSEVIE
ncbi:Uncharacterized membrane protein [Clostridium sp. DSM 8431]|uniref:DUF975 family protein n=1 Tax=Clostridium sp. DSM 8431 TaxID=1761781 RepID=UPI0008E0D49F|nr:DUF975 family protein [Clostridium sp. DSM 8431]SFU70902.1 Uncharacterized membrane protein [Clostridium sp. DSM 8431]